MACDITLPESSSILPSSIEMDVIGKFKELSQAALATDSIYMRAKDTFKELFDGKKVSEAEYANLASQFVSQLAVSTTQQAMQAAMQWASEENKHIYEIEAIKANAELVMAQREKVRLEMCKLEKDTELQCANIKATLATSIRKNGRVLTYDTDGCTPLSLTDEGTEYMQAKAIESQAYSTLADTFRKSGVVTVGSDVDGVRKGLAGDQAGYTLAQEKFAKRQILSFEDSKRSHAANAVSQMISQLIATEIVPDDEYVTQWNAALGYLTANTLDTNYDGIPD